FKEKKNQLSSMFQPFVQRYYEKMGWDYPEDKKTDPLVTVQGGLGTSGERLRLTKDFKMDMTGWASPFLLVPEVTAVDSSTRELLQKSKAEDFYISDVSPLGVPFNNLRNSGSEIYTKERANTGKPGSPCPKGYLMLNTEFSGKPLCTASSKYQRRKLDEIGRDPELNGKAGAVREDIINKSCICHHLGNAALISLGLIDEKKAPQSICPGPNTAWFKGTYSLKEMVDHIYGRTGTIVPNERPHVFANEVVMYVDYFKKLIDRGVKTVKDIEYLKTFKENLEKGMDYCLEISKKLPYPQENLDSIPACVDKQRDRLNLLYNTLMEDPNQPVLL
ncbi:hypothetical protein ACFL5P_03230, partial [candidate division KSB1 bacterium]